MIAQMIMGLCIGMAPADQLQQCMRHYDLCIRLVKGKTIQARLKKCVEKDKLK